MDRQGEVVLRVRVEVHPGDVVLDVDGLPEDAGQFDEAFAGSRRREGLAEADFHARVLTAEDPGVDDLETARGGNVGLAGNFLVEILDLHGHGDGRVGRGTLDGTHLEVILGSFPGEGYGSGGFDRQGNVILRGRYAQRNGTLQPRTVPDGDAVEGKGRRPRRRLDPEGEHLALALGHGQDLAYLECAFIDGPALPSVRDELDHGRAQPAFGAFEGGLEGEQAVGLLVHGNRRGQFHADGGAVGHHAARISFHIVREGRIQRFGLPLLRRAGRSQEDEGSKKPSDTKIPHKKMVCLTNLLNFWE